MAQSRNSWAIVEYKTSEENKLADLLSRSFDEDGNNLPEVMEEFHSRLSSMGLVGYERRVTTARLQRLMCEAVETCTWQQLEELGVGRGRGRVMVAAIDLLPPTVDSGTVDSGTVDSGTVDSGTVRASVLTPRVDSGAVGQGRAAPIRLFSAQTPGSIENHGGWPAAQWISSTPAPAQVTVQYVSPTRLQSEGRVQGEPDFAVLYRALLRRVSALCTVHTEQMWETDFAGLAVAAQGVQTVAASMKREERQRHSDRQGEMEFWGAEGIMVYQGELAPFWPLLQLGQVLHVGKNCTFGLGRYLVL